MASYLYSLPSQFCNAFSRLARFLYGPTPSEAVKDCPLFGLPGELRNTIYRYALLDNTTIQIGASAYTEPALLKTCKIIRTETSSIFYGEATFRMRTTDNDNDIYERWLRTAWQRRFRLHRLPSRFAYSNN